MIDDVDDTVLDEDVWSHDLGLGTVTVADEKAGLVVAEGEGLTSSADHGLLSGARGRVGSDLLQVGRVEGRSVHVLSEANEVKRRH